MLKLLFETILNNAPRIFKFLRGCNLFFFIRYSCPRSSFGNLNARFTINPVLISPKDIVYSVGIGTDISFDLQLIKNFGVTVFAFDPTPKSIDWLNKQQLPANFKVFPVGLASYTGEADFYLPQNENHVSASMISKQSNDFIRVKVKKLGDIMKELNHTSIDLLKIDIEGAEYDVVDDIIDSGIEIRQLLIEFHHRFQEYGIKKTRSSIKKLHDAGFALFYVSPIGEEFSFIKLNFCK
jgi:FkbM family methyltransferase